MIARGYDVRMFTIWIAIHSVAILTGLLASGWTGSVAGLSAFLAMARID
jgi:hypothetical protein